MPKVRSSLCLRSPLMVILMALCQPRMDLPMRRNSPANARTESSRASATICLEKPHRPLPTLSSKSTVIDWRARKGHSCPTTTDVIVEVSWELLLPASWPQRCHHSERSSDNPNDCSHSGRSSRSRPAFSCLTCEAMARHVSWTAPRPSGQQPAIGADVLRSCDLAPPPVGRGLTH